MVVFKLIGMVLVLINIAFVPLWVSGHIAQVYFNENILDSGLKLAWLYGMYSIMMILFLLSLFAVVVFMVYGFVSSMFDL